MERSEEVLFYRCVIDGLCLFDRESAMLHLRIGHGMNKFRPFLFAVRSA